MFWGYHHLRKHPNRGKKWFSILCADSFIRFLLNFGGSPYSKRTMSDSQEAVINCNHWSRWWRSSWNIPSVWSTPLGIRTSLDSRGSVVTEGWRTHIFIFMSPRCWWWFRIEGHWAQKDQLSINNMLPNMLCEDDIWYGIDDQITQMLCDRSEQIEVEERQCKFDVFK